MIQLLIIADDFTGALDTAVQLAKRRIETLVCTQEALGFEDSPASTQVLVVNTESRHLSASAAYDRVRQASCYAVSHRIPHIYKKTDSALRGNIGSELQAVLDVWPDKHLCFIPAYPENQRTTRQGIHYHAGIAIAESPFGMDPFEPVRHSVITAIIAEQSPVATRIATTAESLTYPFDKPVIDIYDASSNQDLAEISRYLAANTACRSVILAGSAGFAEYLPELLGLAPTMIRPLPPLGNLLLISGSMNPISRNQLQHARSSGISVYRLSVNQELAPGFLAAPACDHLIDAIRQSLRTQRIVALEIDGDRPSADSASDRTNLRQQIGSSIGALTRSILSTETIYSLAVFGGDTLTAVGHGLLRDIICPVCEISPGVVVSVVNDVKGQQHVLISKSGGFGDPDIVTQIKSWLYKNASLDRLSNS